MAAVKTFYVTSTGKRHTAECSYARGYTHTVDLTADEFERDWYLKACWRCAPDTVIKLRREWVDNEGEG